MGLIKASVFDENGCIECFLPSVPREGESIFAYFDGDKADPEYKIITSVNYGLDKDNKFDELILHVIDE